MQRQLQRDDTEEGSPLLELKSKVNYGICLANDWLSTMFIFGRKAEKGFVLE